MLKSILKWVGLVLCALLVLCAGFVLYILHDNNSVRVTNYSIYSEKLPKMFDGYTITLVTDFHNADFYQKVASKIIEVHSDIIVLGGDMINMDEDNFDNTTKLIDRISGVSPIYFSCGNHEMWSHNKDEFIQSIKNQGVIVLNNQSVILEKNHDKIRLTGFEDVIYTDEDIRYNLLEDQLSKLSQKDPKDAYYNILIFHRANLFDTVSLYPFDLVLSGHLHGGLSSIPFIRDKVLQQGKKQNPYLRGVYWNQEKGNAMVVSAGLSKNGQKPRILCRPELVVVTLHSL